MNKKVKYLYKSVLKYDSGFSRPEIYTTIYYKKFIIIKCKDSKAVYLLKGFE